MRALSIIMFLCTTLTSYSQWNFSGPNIYNSNAGNVGIGITDPVYKLDVVGSANNFKARFQGTDGYIMFGPANSGWAHIYTDRPAFIFNQSVYSFGSFSSYQTDLSLQTSGTTRLTVSNTSGYVGLGSATSPTAKLHINSSIERESFRLYKEGNTTNYLSIWQGTGGAALDPIGTGKLWLGYDQPTDVYMGLSTGKIGIGTTSPGYKLDVVGPANDWKARFQGPDGYIAFGPADASWAHIYTDRPAFMFNQPVRSIAGNFSSHSTSDLSLQTNGNTRLTISNSTGNVGIGTTSPNQKLTVNGTIYGKEVKVDLNVPGPDYVFEKDYKLPSLDEIKSYIDQHKHLPEVPSAKEMEQNGINVSEMNMILLKKVEELTLIIIEQDKKYKEQQLINKHQQTALEQIQSEINKIKNR
jgi:hypothetical protein